MSERRQGIFAGVLSNIIWGFLPLYWHALRPIDSGVIIFYRIFLCAVSSYAVARIKYSKEELFAPFKDRKLLFQFLGAGILITVNWSLYIWAVNANHVIETSIGYYIEPVVVCLFGVLLFGDRLDRYKTAALFLAAAGIAVIVLYYKRLPAISLLLALSFSLYGAAKKGLSQPPILSLFYETVFLAPVALCCILFLEFTGRGAVQASAGASWKLLLLVFAGILTATPLMLFAESANKAGLFATGLAGYISPSISLLLSIFLFREPFDSVQLLAFAIIWTGLGFFTYGEFKGTKQAETECGGGQEETGSGVESKVPEDGGREMKAAEHGGKERNVPEESNGER